MALYRENMDKTLLKGLMVLEALSLSESDALSIDEASELTGLTRSNAHRTLQTLASAGYVKHDLNKGGYCNTLKLVELGVRQLGRLNFREVAQENIDRLAKKTGETIHLSVLDGINVIYIAKADSIQPIRAYSMIGGRAPAYAVATGKALLAAMGNAYVERFPEMLVSYTATTIVNLKTLIGQLADVRKLGYAINEGEWREGVGGLAVPIFNGFNEAIAAIGISGPLSRLNRNRMIELAPAVMVEAYYISKSMGYAEK